MNTLRVSFIIPTFVIVKRDYINLLIMLALMLTLGACHSSRKASTGQNSGSTTERTTYEDMRRQVGGMSFEVNEISVLIDEATAWIGTPYVYAGHSKSGTDCSGLMMEVFRRSIGVRLPRNSRMQHDYCIEVKRDNVLPGDLLFFATGRDRGRVSHVGLYIGDNRMIHASTSRGVIVSSLSESYYLGRFHSAGRVGRLAELYAARNSNPDVAPASTGMPEISLDDFILLTDSVAVSAASSVLPDSVAQPMSAPSIDDVITEKVDSIFYDFFE